MQGVIRWKKKILKMKLYHIIQLNIRQICVYRTVIEKKTVQLCISVFDKVNKIIDDCNYTQK